MKEFLWNKQNIINFYNILCKISMYSMYLCTYIKNISNCYVLIEVLFYTTKMANKGTVLWSKVTVVQQ